MSRNVILRFAAMAFALACLSLPRNAAALDCPVSAGCEVIIHIEPTDPDPTQICPQGEQFYEISLSYGEAMCLDELPTFVVCGATNTTFHVTLNGVTYQLRPSKHYRWRDVTNCGRLLWGPI